MIDKWIAGEIHIDPASDDWLVLDIVNRNGKLYNVDNRRLLIMHMYARRTQSYNLRVQARLKHWDSTLDRYGTMASVLQAPLLGMESRSAPTVSG